MEMPIAAPNAVAWAVPGDPPGGLLDTVPASPAVFLVWPREGRPYLARTTSLRRRLRRLLRPGGAASRFLNLSEVAVRAEYWLIGSKLEGLLTMRELARRHYPDDYRQRIRLRPPPYVKLILSHRFPRTQVTTRLSSRSALVYGPFRTRAGAERFEKEFLDLFQIRRCQDDFEPSPEHPGCIYGEMNRCLRPCQQVVGIEEYLTEVDRVRKFLSTQGDSLLRRVAAARDRFSNALEFEAAARQHQRYERIREVLRLRDELAADIDCLNGVAVTRSAQPDAVDLWFLLAGAWLAPRRFALGPSAGGPVSMDHRLRDLAGDLQPEKPSLAERQDHLAILARWLYSSWRDGEWLSFDDADSIPYRRLVNAIHRASGRR